MKRLSITILALLISFVASAQVPYKIHNNKLYLIWNGDTLKFKIYGDSTSIGGGNRLNFSHDSLYFPHLATGATDTNIMFVRGSDGKMMYLRPADIGIGNSYWSKNGALHPTDTTNAVAIGTNSLLGSEMLRVDGELTTSDSIRGIYMAASGLTLVEVSATGALDSIAALNLAIDTLPHLYTRMISTDTIYSSSGSIQINYKFTIADDASLNLPAGSGFGQVKIDSVGVKKAAIYNFTYDLSGTPDLVSNTANVVASNTDGNFCLYKGTGAFATMRNRLGYSVTCLMSIIYYE